MNESITAQQRSEKAQQNFLSGYNCAQSIVLAFSDLVEIEEKTLSRLASPFGGGMGRLREVCGAVSAMFVITGLLYGYDGPETGDRKKELYEKVQKLASDFEAKWKTIICRELLGKPQGHDQPLPEERNARYYLSRPCKAIIGDAALILSSFLEENRTTTV